MKKRSRKNEIYKKNLKLKGFFPAFSGENNEK